MVVINLFDVIFYERLVTHLNYKNIEDIKGVSNIFTNRLSSLNFHLTYPNIWGIIM